MAQALQFSPMEFELPVHFDIKLEDVTVSDDNGQKWIEGKIRIHADAFGNNLDTTIPFKTLNSTTINLPLPIGGASINLTVVLKDPHQVCATVQLHWGILHPSTGEQCINI